MIKRIKKMLNFKLVTGAIILAIISMACLHSDVRTENDIKSKVVKLVRPSGGSCSGTQVRALSGENYILTAGHCLVLAENGAIEVITEDGKHLSRKIVVEDPASDLLLLEGIPNMEGLSISDKIYKAEHVRTFTHGLGYDTYKTEGYLIQVIDSKIFIGLADECRSMPKFRIIEAETFFGKISVCLLETQQIVTTAKVVPGSSGGVVVDDSGDMVGVVSATDGTFGYLVRLKDIKELMSNY